MKDFDRRKEYEKYLPEKLYIDNVGWSAFLNQWNDEVLFWVKKTVLMYGIYPWSQYTPESWEKNLVEDNKPVKYMELITRGIVYPPTNEHEYKIVVTQLELHRDFIQRRLNSFKARGIIFSKDESVFVSSGDAIISNESLMFEPVDEETITNKEKELGISFPETYKEFLRVSNGWILDELMLSPVEDISWTFSSEQASYLFWEVMLDDPNLKPGDAVSDEVRDNLGEDFEQYEFERTGILVSKSFDQDYLVFNPHMTTPDGDWLGWGNSSDGDIRSAYQLPKMQSFTSKMEFYYRRDVARRCVDFKELEHKYNQH